MLAALRFIQHLMDEVTGHDSLSVAMTGREESFPFKPIEGYLDAVEETQFVMSNILYTVQAIEREIGWPRNFSQPQQTN